MYRESRVDKLVEEVQDLASREFCAGVDVVLGRKCSKKPLTTREQKRMMIASCLLSTMITEEFCRRHADHPLKVAKIVSPDEAEKYILNINHIVNAHRLAVSTSVWKNVPKSWHVFLKNAENITDTLNKITDINESVQFLRDGVRYYVFQNRQFSDAVLDLFKYLSKSGFLDVLNGCPTDELVNGKSADLVRSDFIKTYKNVLNIIKHTNMSNIKDLGLQNVELARRLGSVVRFKRSC